MGRVDHLHLSGVLGRSAKSQHQGGERHCSRNCWHVRHSFISRRLRAVRGLAPLKLTRARGGVNKMGWSTFHICKGSLDTVFSMDWRRFFVAGPFGKGIARLCGVLAAPTARELRRSLALALRETPTAEIRLDWLRKDAERRGFLNWLKAYGPRKAQLIATCRRRVGGGEFSGEAEEELYWLMQAKEAGCDWCDLEEERLRELPGKSVEGYGVPENVLLSMHDFRRTPAFPKKLSVPAKGGARAIKVAAMARSVSDSA